MNRISIAAAAALVPSELYARLQSLTAPTSGLLNPSQEYFTVQISHAHVMLHEPSACGNTAPGDFF